MVLESPAKPTAPFRPNSFSVAGPVRRTTTSRPKGPKYGPAKVDADGQVIVDGRGRPVREFLGWKQEGKSRNCWDLTITGNGHRWYDRHYAAGQAQAAKEQLEAGFRQGLEFDPQTKRFIEASLTSPALPTVFSESVAWWRAHWSSVEAKSRRETLRYISRPIKELVRDQGWRPSGLEEYLKWQLLPPKPAEVPVPPEHSEAAAWIEKASLPIRDADVAVWQAYAERWRINTRTGKPLAQSSYNRHLADVRQLWAWVCAVHQLPNPWQIVKTGARSSAGARRESTVRPVDRSIVLAPNQVRELARLCGQSSFGPLAEVYVLLLGIAGGRPGETAGVHASEVTTPSKGVGEVQFKRTDRRGIDPSFVDNDDDAAWGPLKGREIERARTAPLPSCDSARIREIIDGSAVTGPLFDGWDWDKFARQVWAPAKAAMATRYSDQSSEDVALVSALSRLGWHDLRHAACSMWLNTPGIEIRVACEWSGHKRLSVFLDIYQGLMPGSQTSAKAKLDAAWGVAG